VPGVAIFLTGDAERVPHALLHNLKHNQVLHDEVVVMTIATRDVPRVPSIEQLVVTGLAPGVHQVVAYLGFKDEPDVTALLMASRNRYGLAVDLDRASYFLSRETIAGHSSGGMARWRQRLFVAMSRNATRASDYFRLPPNRVIELGSVVLI
jgi:KUP system potassium uptake protein